MKSIKLEGNEDGPVAEQYGRLSWAPLERRQFKFKWKLEAGKTRIILSDLKWGSVPLELKWKYLGKSELILQAPQNTDPLPNYKPISEGSRDRAT